MICSRAHDKLKLVLHLYCLQTDDLARMYRLFSRITRGLDPIADCFKEHVESEGMKLVKEVAEAVEAKKEKDAGGQSVLCFLEF
jgi:hypothetical protein